MSQLPFAAGTIISEGSLYQDPKKISNEGKTVTVSLKTKLNYREREGDELDAFFVDILVFGSLAENILESGWKKHDRITFVGEFKGRRWERKVDDGFNEEQSIVITARTVAAIPRFTLVHIDEQDYDGDGGSEKSDRPSSRRGGGDAEEAPRSSRRSSRSNDDAADEAPTSSRRSSRGSSSDAKADDEEEAPRSSRRSSGRRTRETTYED